MNVNFNEKCYTATLLILTMNIDDKMHTIQPKLKILVLFVVKDYKM